MEKMRVGVVGCGVISEIYLKNLCNAFPNVAVVACADLLPEKSQERAEQFGIKAMEVPALLASFDIDLVVNLTLPQAHCEVALAALNHGKHVYNEKPIATSLVEAEMLLQTARKKGLYVGCAPDTFLGAGIQTACQAILDNNIGRPRAATAFFTTAGHERWHPNPGFYYQQGGGPHMDMGPYYITALVAALGSVKEISATSGRALQQRLVGSGPNKGSFVPVEVDSHYSASLTFVNNVVATAIFSFDVLATQLPFLEIYGESGSLNIPDPNFFDGPVLIKRPQDKVYSPLPLLNKFTENMRGLGVAQMCNAIMNSQPCFASGQLATHVLDVLLCIETSAKEKQTVKTSTSCQVPPPFLFGL